MLMLCMCISCKDDTYFAKAGYLYLGVEEDNTTITRSMPVTDEELRVDIISSAGDTIRTYTDYTTQVKDQKLILPAGTYKVAVSSVENVGAAWEMPFYSGVEEVVIKADEITQAQVTCQIANTKVSVKYLGLDKYFTDYCDTVSTNAGKLIYAKDEYRAGYFTSEGDLTANLYLRNKDGNKFVLRKVIRDIEPRTHYTLKYKVDSEENEEAGADIDISVDEDVTSIEYTINIKEEELLKGVPSFNPSGFDTENSVSYQPIKDGFENTSVPSASLEISVPAGIQELYVMTESLSYPDSEVFVWNENWPDDFPSLEAVEGKENVYVIDFGGLLENTLKPDGNKVATHTFKFTVLDQYNQSESITLNFVLKPDVKVVTETPVVWSTFAVLKGSAGNLEQASFIIKEGDSGEEITVTSITKDSDTEFSALVTGLKPGVTYQYKAVAGEDSGEFEPLEIKAVSIIPNLGFEDWSTRSGKHPIGLGNVDYISPNASGAELYWDSGNWGAAAASTVLTQSVDDVAIGSSTKAAKLTSTWAGALGAGAFSAGSIFTGKVQSVSTSGAELLYGREYYGFPTSLKGYYKYTSGKINWTNGEEGNTNTDDEALIYVALSTKQFNLVSKTSNIVPFDPQDKSIFAYGELRSSETITSYKEFEIPLVYRDNMPEPGTKTYIVIVATSSSLGDHFTGSTSSVMYVDEFSLVYDYDSRCLESTSFAGMEENNITINNQ